MKEKTPKKEIAVVVPSVQAKPSLILEGDPEQQIAFAQKAATALMKVVKPVSIQGKPYLQFGGWQTLARFFGATVGIEWTQKLVDDKGKLVGYEARAVVYQQGATISSAEASCMMTEKRWGTAAEYAIKSMAQTRASAKALRNAFGWVAELAVDPKTGSKLQSTPAEEMDYDQTPIKDSAVPTVTYDNPEDEVKKPVKKSNPVDAYLTQKKEIFDLINKIVLHPLEGKEAYEAWVLTETGLELKKENYPTIIERLGALK